MQAAVEAGHVDHALVKSLSEVQEQLAKASTKPDGALRFQRHAFQCTNKVWRQAIQAMLARADAVLMDLSSLSVQNQACAWELGELLDRVPLSKVTLLINESTDLNCLRDIPDNTAKRMAASSPNRNNPLTKWQLVKIGGLSARQPNESYHHWKRRMDLRLDSMKLAGWLLSTAGPEANIEEVNNSTAAVRWAAQARWPWIILLALSALWAAERFIHR